MADKTGIEWADATWNPIVGCSIVSPGCTNCYAMKMAARIEAMQPEGHYAGLTQPSKAGPVWTGKLALAPDSILTQPLRWKNPRTIFVNSMGDLFHEDAPDESIDKVFAIMALAPQHTFLVLTKRAARMQTYVEAVGGKGDAPKRWLMTTVPGIRDLFDAFVNGFGQHKGSALCRWPLPNVWLGVSTERQLEADERIPLLLATPAAKRFISAEPLLGPIDLQRNIGGTLWIGGQRGHDGTHCGIGTPECPRERHHHHDDRCEPGLDWVIAGGESGKDARPMHPDWARGLRDQCAAARVPFFFKQWGEWTPSDPQGIHASPHNGWMPLSGASLPKETELYPENGAAFIERVGKARAGRLLDGVEHSERPQP